MRSCEPYAPAEDTYLLEDALAGESGRLALDIGTGPGRIARVLEESFEVVVGTDINFSVLRGQGGMQVCCSAAEALRGGFELIACNMPYLDTATVEDPATDGGPGGTAVPLKIMRSAAKCLSAGGRLYFVTTSLSDYMALIGAARALGLDAEIAARKRLFFEELLVVRASRQ